MRIPTPDAVAELELPSQTSAISGAIPSDIRHEVTGFFDEFRDGLLRYAQSLGLSAHDGEDVIQDTFLALFRHLELGRPRQNLRGWIFRVTHNLALRHRYASRTAGLEFEEGAAENHPDPTANPEELVAWNETRKRLLLALQALPALDRQCLCLRAEGLRYREIVGVLGISLGAVANSLTRALGRLARVEER